MSGPRPLAGNQALAVNPAESVWLSASAGTGKTHVLSSRVLRLLMQRDVDPSQILCLTFTKAGATEMAARVNETLARWVRLPDETLFLELDAIGAPSHPDARAHARTLFAKVLDCPGGGLRIDTIHAFAQWLLAAFPHEAGLTPGVRAMEDRDKMLLSRNVLVELLLDAEAQGDAELLDAVAMLSLKFGPDDVERYLLRCADARDAWFGPGAWTPPLRPRVNGLLGLPSDADESDVAALCADDAFDVRSLQRCRETLAAWDSATGREGATAIAAWLARDGAARAATIDELFGGLFTKKDGAPKQLNNILKRDPDYEDYISRVATSIEAVRELRALVTLAGWLTPALTLGRKFALAWEEAKEREGLIDFNDQIRRAAALLNRSELSDWIRYKLDRRFDHILIDEAQDTNAAQWQIIDALTGDFFAGEGVYDEKLRTIFVVGDYKQAIFRFQGTSPENFEAARRRFRTALSMVSGNEQSRELQELGLGQSFRTCQTVLDFVNDAITHIGHVNFGLSEPPEPHTGDKRSGQVVLWRPIGIPDDDDDSDAEESDEGAEAWLSKPDRQLADKIAQQVKRWIDDGFPLVKGGERRAGPGDVMVLVRKRKELAGLIVARLHAAKVPVAGVDRLRLGAPLAVRDLIAALRFAAQPLDDLNLASLLVSPLIGWTQEQLLEHGYRPEKMRLWDHLRRVSHPDVATLMAQLTELLAIVDYEPPQALLHWLLVGPWQGRRKLVARLGREANDPIDELLNAAHAYAGGDTPSLNGFLNWFDAGDGELKREAGKSDGQVRVMTVHGSKGLQAPIVILADAASNPDNSQCGAIDLPEKAIGPGELGRKIPLPSLNTNERRGPIREAQLRQQAEERQEHWRLLYVAMTRAEEALFVTGSLGPRERVPAEDSWYNKLSELFSEDDWLEDPLWGARAERGQLAALPPVKAGRAPELPLPPVLPMWLQKSAGAEPRPPRPLAPSSLGEDISPDPPLPPGAGREAARRGVLIHKLLERLPDVAADDRRGAALRWLAKAGREMEESARAEIADAALAVLAQEDWADLFTPGALAEVPIAAVVGERVIAGTIDRLVVRPDCIRLVDFKTSRRPPKSLDDVPVAILRQMAAYAASLEATYPGRRIEAALLYTQTPQLIEIPADVLGAHKRALFVPQESFQPERLL